MCSIGKMPDEDMCCSSSPHKKKKDFSPDDWLLLKYRSRCSQLKRVCLNHEIAFLKTFLNRNKFCCDPKSLHKAKQRKVLKRISLSLSKKSLGTLNLVPGTGLCLQCYQQVSADYKNVVSPFPSDDEMDDEDEDSDSEETDGGEDSEVKTQAEPMDDEWTENPYVALSEPSTSVSEQRLVAEQFSSQSARISTHSRSSNMAQSGFQIPGDSPVLTSKPPASVSNKEDPGGSGHIAAPILSPVAGPASKKDQIGSEKSSPALPSSQKSDSSFSSAGELSLEKLNAFLVHRKVTPIFKRQAQKEPSTRPAKIAKVASAAKAVLEKIVQAEVQEPGHDSEFQQIINQLKARFLTCVTRQEKVNVLSVLPQSWSLRKVASEFNVTVGFARGVRDLVKLKGILPMLTITPRGARLSAEVIDKVIKFYEEDEVNVYIMPDKNQCLSVTINGEKVKKQKRLLLANLKELYLYFSERNPGLLGFSSFAALRPRYCLLAGSPGTHSVCVCQKHENMKLMIEGANLKLYSSTEEGAMKNYKQCLAAIRCEPPTEICFLNQCEQCPGLDPMREMLDVHFDAELMDEVTFNSWVSSGSGTRCNLLTITKCKEDFIEDFLSALEDLKKHDFLAFEQRKCLQSLKENLPVGEAVVLMDFAENYRMIIQNEVQSYHWTATEATVHPFVTYYREEENGEVKHLNMVIISDTRSHSAATIYSFQKHFINFIKTKIQPLKKIHYFSDSTTSQYRNRNAFANLCKHIEDFGLDAEWHFFETSHGKSPCDSLGGTIKRCAAKASLQGTLIRSPEELYSWAKSKWSDESKVFVQYVSDDEIKAVADSTLKIRLSKTIAVAQTFEVHHVLPLSSSKLQLKKFSNSNHLWRASVFKN